MNREVVVVNLSHRKECYMPNQIEIIKADNNLRQQVINLLESEKLPVEDLPASLDNFLIAVDDDAAVGAIGMEQYDNYALLRSLVVHKKYRDKNIAAQLVHELEQKAAATGIIDLFLLTETAPGYFTKKGYATITRDDVPVALQASSEFSYVCPVSAIVMKKSLQ